jgi:hypothetical protein
VPNLIFSTSFIQLNKKPKARKKQNGDRKYNTMFIDTLDIVSLPIVILDTTAKASINSTQTR